jgi:hypothetical protein
MSEIVPFGKYRGQPIEALAADRGYCDWLMSQTWFRERYGAFYTLIINNFSERNITPCRLGSSMMLSATDCWPHRWWSFPRPSPRDLQAPVFYNLSVAEIEMES